jgi:hypothetical protein
MTYISAPERHARRQYRQGLLESLPIILRLKFGAAGEALLPEITELRDPTVLQRIIERVEAVATPDELRAIYSPDAKTEG